MIIAMKKAKIVVLKEDKDKLLKSLQRYGELMLISTTEEMSFDTSKEDAFIQRTENSIKFLKNYSEKKRSLGDTNVVDYQEFIEIDPNRKRLLEQIESADKEINELISENDATQEEINSLLPWKDLNFITSEINSPKYALIRAGFVDVRNVGQVASIIQKYGGDVQLLSNSKDGQAIVFASFYEDDEEILNVIRNQGFIEVKLPNFDRLFKDIIEEKEDLIKQNNLKIEELNQKLRDLANDSGELELLNDQLVSLSELKKAEHLSTLEAIYLEGWVRADRVERLNKAVNGATDIYDLDITDPLPDETPPTVTQNNRFVSPFETITNMFARPTPGEVDPNPVMSIWYIIIFGLMMGDAGYGLAMIVIFYTLIKVMKPKGEGLKLFKVLLYSGFTTIAWGIVFGSYFGFSFKPIIEPMKDPLLMLILSFIIGGLHIITGILVKAYDNFRQGKYFSMVVDQFTWVAILVGLGLLFVPSVAHIGKYMALSGSAIILITAGRTKSNIFGKLTGGFFNLYGIANYISDILSYSRILALSLSSAVIAMVMNLLAGLIQGSIIGIFFSIFIYIIGHLFNIAMSLLSAYVHDSRLQYIEFFGKFYEGGGYEFKPLSFKLKYIDEVQDANNVINN